MPGIECHCSACGLTFSSLRAFDMHQRPTKDGRRVVCLDPREVGLEAKVRTSEGRRRTVWGVAGSRPSPEEIAERDAVRGSERAEVSDDG